MEWVVDTENPSDSNACKAVALVKEQRGMPTELAGRATQYGGASQGCCKQKLLDTKVGGHRY